MTESTACVCINVRAAAQQLTRIYDQALRPRGMTITQFSQLNTIRNLGESTLMQLSDATGLDRSTLGRNVRLLEAMGLIKMQVGKQDARTRVIARTKKGRSAIREGVPLWLSIQEKLTRQLGHDKRHLLEELMSDLASPTLMDEK